MASAEPIPPYPVIRERLLQLNPADLGLAPTKASPDVWGVFVEIGFEVGFAALLSLADGTAALHYSTGKALLGRGDYPPVADATKAIVLEAQKFLGQFPRAADFPLAEPGQALIVLLAYSGTYASAAPEKLLNSGEHELAPIYKNVLEALRQLHLVADKRHS